MSTTSAQLGSDSELRVLVLAPTGRDAEVTCEMLRASGTVCHRCASLDELGGELARGAGAIVVAAEALGGEAAGRFAQLLRSQEPWSDIPIVLAAAHGAGGREAALGRLERAGAVTVLERPIRLVTMQTVLQSALRARRRQYEMRDLLEQLRVGVERLDAERIVRERFVSLLAHDLRGPLSTATTAARLLVAYPEALEQRRELALRIERSALRMDRMIQDLLDANRVRAGERLPLDLQPCDLAEIAADVVADLDPRDRRRVRSRLPERLEGVWAPDQLRRALWNLVTNALKYGAPDAPVDLTGRPRDDGVIVSVHNEGPAIPADEQRRIFEPFGRARGSEALAKGWGLGLTLVRGCAEAHGGSVELSSTAEGGTTFSLLLPRDARAPQPRGA